MTLVITQVAAVADDGHETSVGNVVLTNASFNPDDDNEWVAAMFRNIAVPQAASLVQAYFEFWITSNSLDEPEHNLYFENSVAPANLSTTGNDISGRTKTSATWWNSTDLGIASGGGWATSPSMLTQAQSLIDNVSWVEGESDILGLVTHFGDNDPDRDLSVGFYELDSTKAPKLVIEYDDGGGEGDTGVNQLFSATTSEGAVAAIWRGPMIAIPY